MVPFRAQGSPHRHLPGARGDPHEQQVRHVYAHNQEQEAHRAEQHQ